MRFRREEIVALEHLKRHFPQYSGLVWFDKPDLIDTEKSVGVEVVCAVNPEVKKQESYFCNKLKGRPLKIVSKMSTEQFKKNSMTICAPCEDELGNDALMYTVIRIFDSTEKKLLHRTIQNKYTKKYPQLNSIDLYIFFRHMCREIFKTDEFYELIKTAHICEEKYGKIFKKIMIDFFSELVILDLEHDCVTEISNYGK